MKSVADQSHDDTVQAVLRMSASERVALALRLGEQAVDLYASANRVGRDESRRALRRNNQLGRRHSAAAAIEGR
jgi:hypothetical protein